MLLVDAFQSTFVLRNRLKDDKQIRKEARKKGANARSIIPSSNGYNTAVSTSVSIQKWLFLDE
jgi:hypothetical protein